MKQILINIISNAIKFTSQGFVDIRSEYFILTNKDYDQQTPLLKITIQDSGVGMSEDGLKNLFNLFGKLDQHASINRQGTGLGLFISKQLITNMGGDIKVKS